MGLERVRESRERERERGRREKRKGVVWTWQRGCLVLASRVCYNYKSGFISGIGFFFNPYPTLLVR